MSGAWMVGSPPMMRTAGAVEPNVGAEIPRGARCLVGRIAAEDHDRRCVLGVAQGGGAALFAREGLCEGDVVGGAVVVDVIGVYDRACELLKEVGFLVGDAVGADDANALAASCVTEFAELFADVVEGVFPGDGF